jgi:hypothetical protein
LACITIVLNFAFQYAIRSVQDKQKGMKLNGTHQLLAYAVDVNILRENVDSIQLDASKEVGLEVNPEKTEYVLVSRRQKARQGHSINVANRSFEDVAKFKYM